MISLTLYLHLVPAVFPYYNRGVLECLWVQHNLVLPLLWTHVGDNLFNGISGRFAEMNDVMQFLQIHCSQSLKVHQSLRLYKEVALFTRPTVSLCQIRLQWPGNWSIGQMSIKCHLYIYYQDPMYLHVIPLLVKDSYCFGGWIPLLCWVNPTALVDESYCFGGCILLLWWMNPTALVDESYSFGGWILLLCLMNHTALVDESYCFGG